jgi:hypothetical protein
VALRLPESHADLRAYLYGRDNRYTTWKAIRDIPEVVRRSDVESLWKWAKANDEQFFGHERSNVAAVAAHYGHDDALEFLFRDPGDWPEWEAIESVTPYREPSQDPAAAKRWFAENRARLVFDAEKMRYQLRDGGR